MSTDPTNDVGWTVPDDLEWGGDAHDGTDGESSGDDDANAREPATTRPEPPADGPTTDATQQRRMTDTETATDQRAIRQARSFVDDLDLGSPASTSTTGDEPATDGAPKRSSDNSGQRGATDESEQRTATDGSGQMTTTEPEGSQPASATAPEIASTTATDPAPDATGSFADRHPADLPPAPVLAAHVDLLREERDANEAHLDAVRDRYERELRARNKEIARLRRREGASFLERCWMRLEDLF